MNREERLSKSSFTRLPNVKGTVAEDARITDSPLRPEPALEIRVRPRRGMLRCSRCGRRRRGYDQDGGVRRRRDQDFGCFRVELVAAMPIQFARHAELREQLGMATYFADPYPSYRRGGNENRNGAIRRHLPKRTRIDPSMTDEIQAIVDEINNRPMRVLGYRTPAEAFTDELLPLTEQQCVLASWRPLCERCFSAV